MPPDSIDIRASAAVAPSCLEDPTCKTMQAYPKELRTLVLGACASAGIQVDCHGPREGQYHPICSMSNLAQCALNGRLSGNLRDETKMASDAVDKIDGIIGLFMSRAV